MATSTIFRDFSIPVENKSLIQISKDINSDKYKSEIEEIRKLVQSGKKEEANDLKKKLLAFTPSATFKEKRQLPFIDNYSGYVHLDFDKLYPDQLQSAFQKVKTIPYTFLCFVSPSGNGLKVFVEVNTGLEYHEIAYLQVLNYYEKETGLKADPSCKDVTRLCFFSYDPNAYKNIQSEKFLVNGIEGKQNIIEETIHNKETFSQSPTQDIDAIFKLEHIKQFTDLKSSYNNGNRNNYIHLFASNANRYGIQISDVEDFCIANFELPSAEILNTIKSAYKHHNTEFGKFTNNSLLESQKITSIENIDDSIDYLKNSPKFPDEIFDNLPDILKKGASAFDDKRERDVFLTGALAILSGFLPNVRGVYDRQTVYPNLFAFIIAPAASGKGAMKFAKALGDKYHDHLLDVYKKASNQYEFELKEFQSAQRFRKKGESLDVSEPDKPPFKVVFIPANSSYAKILKHINENEGTGIICETEADTMGNMMKQDWGNYSEMLRMAFQHEAFGSSRKTNDEYIYIKEPKISIALSGTPNQVNNLISSAEDGLFSRFVFYAFKAERVWRDVSPYGNPINLNDHFQLLSNDTFNMIQFFQQSDTYIHLSRDQWINLNQSGASWLSDVTIFTDEEAASVPIRLGLIFYRFIMIITAMRKYENAENTKDIYCTDDDFNLAFAIANTFIEHSKLMFNNLPHQSETVPFKGSNKKLFFDELAFKFKRDEAVLLGNKFNIKERTVGSLLKKLCDQGLLTQPEYGWYQKV